MIHENYLHVYVPSGARLKHSDVSICCLNYGKSTVNCNLDGLLTCSDVFMTIMMVYFNAYQEFMKNWLMGMLKYSRKQCL